MTKVEEAALIKELQDNPLDDSIYGIFKCMYPCGHQGISEREVMEVFDRVMSLNQGLPMMTVVLRFIDALELMKTGKQ